MPFSLHLQQNFEIQFSCQYAQHIHDLHRHHVVSYFVCYILASNWWRYRWGYPGLFYTVSPADDLSSCLLEWWIIFVAKTVALSYVFLYLQEFKMPHDIVETGDSSVFVGDTDNKSVFKFTTESKLWCVLTVVMFRICLNWCACFYWNCHSQFSQDIGKKLFLLWLYRSIAFR